MCAAFVISASYDKQIRFWDGSSGRTVRCFSFQDSQVNALLHIPDTTYLTVAGFGVVRIYDISAVGGGRGGASGVGGVTQAPPLFSSYENQLAMNFTSLGSFPISSPKGLMNMMDSSSSSHTLFDKSIDLGVTQPPLADVPDGVVSVLYATSEDGHIRFFNAAVPTTLQPFRDISTGAAITCSALSPDRQTLLTGSQIGRVSVWHLPTIVSAETQHSEISLTAPYGMRPIQEIAFENDYTALRSIAVDPLARWAVTATNAGKLHFLRFVEDRETEKVTSSTPAAAKQECDECAAAKHIDVSGGADATDFAAPNCAHAVVQHSESIYRSAIASTDNVGNSTENVASLSATSGSLFAPIQNSLDPACAKAEGTSSHGPNAGDAGENGKNKENQSNANDILSRGSTPRLSPQLQKFVMEVFHSFQAHYKYILKVAISPNADLLVTCCADYTVGRFVIPPELQIPRVLCAEKSEESAAGGPGANNRSVAVVPVLAPSKSNGEEKAGENTTQTAAAGGEIEIAEASASAPPQEAEKELSQQTTEANGEDEKKETCQREFNDQSSLVSSVMPSLSGEGQEDSHSGGATYFKVLKPLTGHTRWVWDCVFSGCGQYLFTASSDHFLRMWNGLLTERVQSTSFSGHTKPVICCILYYEKKV